MKSSLLFLCTLGSLAAALPTPDADNGGLILPPGFRALIVADDLVADRQTGKTHENLRFLAAAPNGDLYAKTYFGGLFALRDNDGDGRFEQREEFGSGGGTALALRDRWLYHSTNTAVYRYALTPGVLVPTGEPEVMVDSLPVGPGHAAKSFAFDDQGRLLVEVGSPTNVFGNDKNGRAAAEEAVREHQKSHGGFWRFSADKPGQHFADGYHFSTGHRHALALAWNPVAREFFMAMMGRDQLNAVAPAYYDELDNAERIAEEMHRLVEGANFGWPYTYWDPIKKARMLAPEYGGDGRRRADTGQYNAPVVAFPAHWAPLQMAFYYGRQFPAKYHGGAFVAFHGSWNREPLPQEGFNIGFVPFDEKGVPRGTFEVFTRSAKASHFRMGGVAVAPDGSLFISETNRGRIWRIIYTGEPADETNPAAPVAGATKPVASTAVLPSSPGKEIYVQMCAPCHMADGTGAGQQQPALLGSNVVKGDPRQLMRVVLEGPASVLPADRIKYTNIMPPFGYLADSQIASLLTYLRQAFGDNASPITAAQVTATRAQSTAP